MMFVYKNKDKWKAEAQLCPATAPGNKTKQNNTQLT